MERQPLSQTLPVLYRVVLDSIAELEALGCRREAAQVRAEAIRAYSGAWNPAAARRLQGLRSRADRIALGRRPRRAAAREPLERIDLGRTPV